MLATAAGLVYQNPGSPLTSHFVDVDVIPAPGTVGLAAFATALGIPLDSVAVTVEGDIDFRGFFAIDDTIRPGFQRLRVQVALGSTASQADIDRLVAVVNGHCPVLDMLSTPVPTAIDVRRV